MNFLILSGVLLLVLPGIAVPAALLTTSSQVYLISNPTYEQLQALGCHRACMENLCSSWGNSGTFLLCPNAYCIEVYNVEFLGTMEIDGVSLQSIKVVDRNRGKLDNFMRAVGVDYLKIDGGK